MKKLTYFALVYRTFGYSPKQKNNTEDKTVQYIYLNNDVDFYSKIAELKRLLLTEENDSLVVDVKVIE